VSYFTLRTSLILKETIKDLYKRPIMKAAAAPVGTPWMWTLAFGHRAALALILLPEQAKLLSQTCDLAFD
jgi:hypothetical protein